MTGRPPPSASADARGRARGFTFLELLVVMAAMAVFFGLGIGYLVNIGKSTLSAQAAAKLAEAGNRCLNLSSGGRRATIEVRETKEENGTKRLTVFTAVERPFLTANFEPAPKERPDLDGFFNAAGGPDHYKQVGPVKLEDDGQNAVSIQRGGYVDFGTRAGFAVTDGLLVTCRVKPAPGGTRMLLLQSDLGSQHFWSLSLLKPSGTGPDSYQVELRLYLVPADAVEVSSTNAAEPFTTRDACVPANRWSDLNVSFDGRDVSIRVEGVEQLKPERRKGAAAPTPAAGATALRRFASTADGVAHVTLSAPASPYMGLVDTLQLSGIFRSAEDVQVLSGDVEVLRPTLPLRVVYANGRLDPAVHAQDVVLLLASQAERDAGSATEIRYGLYGSIPPPRHVLLGGAGEKSTGLPGTVPVPERTSREGR